MSTKYVRKTDHAKWTQEDLSQAINAVNQGLYNSRAASRKYGIPRTTLQRHIKLGSKEKKRQGRTPILGSYEKELEEFLLKVQVDGVKWTLADLRRVAFEFAERRNVKHHFNREKRLANYNWVNSFLSRHPNLSVERGVKGVLYATNIKPKKTVDEYLKDHMQNVDRCRWTEDQLIQAIDSVNNGNCSRRSASKKFGIPRTTLIRHIKEGTKEKKRLGRMPIFGELEKELKEFLLNEQSNGNTWSMPELRRVAFNFAEIHNIKHKFNKEKGLASYEWVHAFTSRHPEIVVQTRKYTRSSIELCEANKIYELSDMLQIILEEGDEVDISCNMNIGDS